MRLTYGGLKTVSLSHNERAAAGSRSEIQLIKGNHICLTVLDLHFKTHTSVLTNVTCGKVWLWFLLWVCRAIWSVLLIISGTFLFWSINCIRDAADQCFLLKLKHVFNTVNMSSEQPITLSRASCHPHNGPAAEIQAVLVSSCQSEKVGPGVLGIGFN